MKFAIGVPVYQGVSHVANLLTQLALFRARADLDARVIVVDDGSDAPVRVRLAALCEELGADLVCHEINRGVPSAWNTIVAHADADIVVIANDDIRIDRVNALTDMVATLRGNERFGIVSIRETRIDAAGLPGFSNATEDVVPFLHAWPSGSLFALKTDLWRRVVQPDGSVGFWESLRLYGEEWDFGFSLARMGYLTCVLRHCEYLHFKGASTQTIRDTLYDRDTYFALDLPRLQEALCEGPTPLAPPQSRVGRMLNRVRRRTGVPRGVLSARALSLKHEDARFLSDPHAVARDVVRDVSMSAVVTVDGTTQCLKPIPVPR